MPGSSAAAPSFPNGPKLPNPIIQRPDVLARLDGVVTRPFTSLTAPAGFGKSVLAAQWAREWCPVPVTWLDLGPEDDDPERLLARLAAAVAQVVGVEAPTDRGWLAEGQARLTAQSAALLTELLRGFPESVLVMDGMRASGPMALFVDIATAVHNAVDCGLHVLGVGRCIPPPELIPLQLRGAVANIGVDDLRLTPDEVATMFEAHSGRPIGSALAAALTAALDGWMVGAVIVAMSSPRRPASSVDRLLHAAADSIGGYYSSEVFDPLPADVRAFLLQTSCVEELPADLADRLADRTGSQYLLRGLHIFGLPVSRGLAAGSFRYDTPFRQYLDERRRHDDPAGRSASLRTAGDWYRARHEPLDAAECYSQVGDWDAAVDVVMTNLKPILEGDEFSRLAKIVAAAPADVLRANIALAVTGAWVLMMDGRVSAANELLSVFRPLMSDEGLTAADLIQSSAVAWVEDMGPPLASAESALAATDEADQNGSKTTELYNPTTHDVGRSVARANALVAGAFAGWWERVRPHLVDIPADVSVIAPQFQVVKMRGQRALFMVLSGDVAEALAEAELALTVARESGLEDHRAAAEAHLALGEAYRLSGRFDEAAGPLGRAHELASLNDRRNLVAAAIAAQLHLLVDTGMPRDALDLLERYRAGTRHRAPAHLAGLLRAAEARAYAATGDLFGALRVTESKPKPAAVAAVEVSVALGVGEVARARDTVGQWGPDGSVGGSLRRSLARVLVQDAAGGTREAEQLLRSALRIAANYDLVQPVVECGAPIVRLLRRIDGKMRGDPVVRVARRAEALIATRGSAVARFTAREAAVLAHLDKGLSLPAVANAMFLSVNTVKSYVKSIYRKLGASSRSEALAAWRESLPPREPR